MMSELFLSHCIFVSYIVMNMDTCKCLMECGPRAGQPCGKPLHRFGQCQFHFTMTNTIYRFHAEELRRFLSLPPVECERELERPDPFYPRSMDFIQKEDERRVAFLIRERMPHFFQLVNTEDEPCAICYTQSSRLLAFPCHRTHVVCEMCILRMVHTDIATTDVLFVDYKVPMTHSFQCPFCRHVLQYDSPSVNDL